MRHLERKDGFTLVELVVGIACAAMVMAAAAALLLMGARIQRTLRDEAKEQQTVRIVLTMLEDMVSEGQIKSVETTDGTWKLLDESNNVLLTFKDGQLLGVGDSVLLDGLTDAEANLHGNLLNFTFATDRGTYGTSTYCRTVVIKDKAKAEDTKNTVTGTETVKNSVAEARYKFLQTLCGQYGSTGQIMGTSTYYSEWYIGDYASNPGWNSSTPWCACFLSWAAQNISGAPKFANVTTGWNSFSTTYLRSSNYTPIPGDYIFFDWEGGDTADPDHNDPDHVGAVLYVQDMGEERSMIYTIEGNSGNRVAIRSYLSTDPRIMGYGVLPWA